MFRTLRGRLALAFVTLSVGGIALVSLLINVTVDREFELYVRQNMQERAGRISRSLAEAYQGPNGWPPEFLMEITHWSLAEGLDITLEHPPGTVVWRSRDAASADHAALPPEHPHGPRGVPDLNLAVPVKSQGKQVATLRVTSGPEGMFTEHDLHFRSGLNRVLFYSALGTRFPHS